MLNFFYRGELAKEFYQDRQQVIERYERLLSQAQASGQLANDVDTAIAAKHLFILISGTLRCGSARRIPISNVASRNFARFCLYRLETLAPRKVRSQMQAGVDV